MHRKVGRRWASYARAPKRISYIDVEPCMHKTAGARDNMNSIYARTCTRVHRFDMTRARMCDIWLAACVLRWGRGFFPGARARTQIRAQPRLRYCCRHALHPVWACRHLEHPNLVGCRAAVAALAAFVAATAAAKRSFTRPLRSGRKDASFMISDTLLVKLELFFVGAAAAAAGAAATAAAGLRFSTTRFCGAAFCFACCAGAPWRTGFTGAALNACCTAAVAIAVAGSLAAAAAAPADLEAVLTALPAARRARSTRRMNPKPSRQAPAVRGVWPQPGARPWTTTAVAVDGRLQIVFVTAGDDRVPAPAEAGAGSSSSL